MSRLSSRAALSALVVVGAIAITGTAVAQSGPSGTVGGSMSGGINPGGGAATPDPNGVNQLNGAPSNSMGSPSNLGISDNPSISPNGPGTQNNFGDPDTPATRSQTEGYAPPGNDGGLSKGSQR